MVKRIAPAVDATECDFYCKDDNIALLFIRLHRMPANQKDGVTKAIDSLL